MGPRDLSELQLIYILNYRRRSWECISPPSEVI